MDNSNWGVLAVVLTAIVTFLGGIAKIVQELRKQSHDQKTISDANTAKGQAEKDSRTIQEYEKFIERQSEVIEAQRRELHDIKNELNRCNLRITLLITARTRADTWIMALEDTLRQKEIPFRPYEPMKDSTGSFDAIQEGS